MRRIDTEDGPRYEMPNGDLLTEAEFDRLHVGSAPAPCSLSSTPVKLSDFMAVHPRQVAEAAQFARARGVPTEFHPDGRPLIRSRAHQKAYLKIHGWHNRDGGYGD